MEISLLQAFALGLLAFIAGLDMFNGLTHMHRPVVLGPLVGLILGDLHTGILTGGTLELVWMGLAPLAGPPRAGLWSGAPVARGRLRRGAGLGDGSGDAGPGRQHQRGRLSQRGGGGGADLSAAAAVCAGKRN